MCIDAIIIGVHKCATTSLWRALAQHDGVCTHLSGQLQGDYIKSLEEGVETNDLQPLLVGKANGQLSLGRDTSLYDDESKLKRLIALLPDIKIFICIREPSERAFSAYMHAKTKGFELEYPDFRSAVDAQISDDYQKRFPPLLNYVDHSKYWSNINRLLSIVPSAQVSIVDVDDLKVDLPGVCHRLFKFMDVESIDVTPIRENTRYSVKSRFLNTLIRDSVFIKRLVRLLLTRQVRVHLHQLLMKLNKSDKGVSETLNADTRKLLDDVFEPEMYALNEYMNSQRGS